MVLCLKCSLLKEITRYTARSNKQTENIIELEVIHSEIFVD